MAGIPARAQEDIIRAGRRMDQLGWVPATAGNISVRFHDYDSVRQGRIAITRSGGHKGFLDSFSVIEVDLDGKPLTAGAKPSAETLLHCQIYKVFADAGAVLHGHSVPGTVLSMTETSDAITLEGYELFKAFTGQSTHDVSLAVPLFPNDQDMARLAGVIAPYLAHAPLGYYIRGHGIYVWGPDMDGALARLEAVEFMLACELQRRQIAPSRAGISKAPAAKPRLGKSPLWENAS
jgi:methylthioribulose-1-phosphate dehydratase